MVAVNYMGRTDKDRVILIHTGCSFKLVLEYRVIKTDTLVYMGGLNIRKYCTGK
jgi:hypothetical protein